MQLPILSREQPLRSFGERRSIAELTAGPTISIQNRRALFHGKDLSDSEQQLMLKMGDEQPKILATC
jgi:hypothetical protein